MKTKDSEGVKHGVSIGDASTESGNASAASKPAVDRSPGQRVSQERGVATHFKKNPGKRPKQGGN